MLTEKRIQNVKLTDTQKKVLGKLKVAKTDRLGFDDISQGRQIIAARDLLKKLGLITFDEAKATAGITDDGEQVMKDTGLTDNSGQLTDEGNKFAYDDEDEDGDGKPDNKKPGMDDKPGLDFGGSDNAFGDMGDDFSTGPSNDKMSTKNPFESRLFQEINMLAEARVFKKNAAVKQKMKQKRIIRGRRRTSRADSLSSR